MANKKSYEPTPQIPEQSLERYRTMLQVLSGDLTVSEAARRLQISRNHFQTLMHRGLKGLIDGMSLHPAGRPAKRQREKDLERHNERLIRENRRLQSRVETIDRLLTVAGDLLKGRAQPTGRPRQKKTSPTQKGQKDTDEEGLYERLFGARRMIELGLPPSLAAPIAGISLSTLRRWSRRDALGLLLRKSRGPQPHAPLDPTKTAAVAALVRQLHGLAGAAALSKSVPGVSRRQAAVVKHETLTQIERERQTACRHLVPSFPGLIRSFDQLQMTTIDGPWYALISADTATPFRTSALLTPRYDGPSVATAIEKDFTLFGTPLVWRADRAKAHQTPEVLDTLRRFRVLPLHGPPRYPQFYGSLERQNREHRDWLSTLGSLDPDQLQARFSSMLAALNTLWRRPSLGWLTAAEAWAARPTLNINRDHLHLEIHDRAAHIAQHLDARASSADMASRLAIEQTLTRRGLLGRYSNRRC